MSESFTLAPGEDPWSAMTGIFKNDFQNADDKEACHVPRCRDRARPRRAGGCGGMHTRGPGYEGDDKKQRGLFPRDPHPLCALGLWGDAAARKPTSARGNLAMSAAISATGCTT